MPRLSVVAAYNDNPGLERELRLHLRPDLPLHFKRISINQRQIALYYPRKDTDTRSTRVVETVEPESMPARVLRRLLRGEIERLLPFGALAVQRSPSSPNARGCAG